MKTIQELEKEKLQEEINLLRERIKKEYGESQPESRWSKFVDFFKQWYSVMLALIAVGGGFWGIFYPVKTFLTEQQKTVQYSLNENMIGALDKLKANDRISRENSIIILSYYDLNAIPILLSKYIVLADDSIDAKQDYIEAINLIYSRKQTGIIERIIIKMNKNYKLFKKYTTEEDINVRWRNQLHIGYFLNLIYLVDELSLSSHDKKEVKNFYADILKDIKNNEPLLEFDGVADARSEMENYIKDGN